MVIENEFIYYFNSDKPPGFGIFGEPETKVLKKKTNPFPSNFSIFYFKFDSKKSVEFIGKTGTF